MSERRRRRRRSNSYEVGYGKPPVSQQFGQETRTGRVNTEGRPKNKKASSSFDDALNEKVSVTEGGRKRSYTRREVAYKQLARLASEGNLRAIKMVKEYDERRKEGEKDADPIVFDRKAMKDIMKKHDEETAERAIRKHKSGKGDSSDD